MDTTTTETVSVGGAAHMLGKSTRTILRMIEDGRLTVAFRTEGGHRRIARSDVEALVERAS